MNKKNLLLPFLIAIAILAFMYFHILLKLINAWWIDPNYSHGFLIPLISGYFIWRKREDLKNTNLSPSWWGLFIIFIAGLFYLVGKIAGELFTQRISFLISMVGFIFVCGGRSLWTKLWIPVCYLIFMIPLPYIVYNSITFPLKLLATKISTSVLHLLGVTIYSEGNIIYLPNISLEVADACSGIRSLISVLALAVVIALFTQKDILKRVFLVILSIPVVLLCNMLRIIVTGLLASKDPQLSTGFFHTFSGEIIFLLGVAILMGLALLLSNEKGIADVSIEGQNIGDFKDECHSSKLTVIPCWSASLLLVVFFILSLMAAHVESMPLLKPFSKFPEKIDGFQKLSDSKLNKNVLKNLKVDDYLMRSFKGPGNYVLWLYIGYFDDQKEGAMIHSPKHCYPGGGWHPLASRIIKISVPETNKAIEVNEYIIQKKEEKQLVYYWYQSRGRVIANEYRDRFYMLIDSILKRRSEGALVRISGPADNLNEAKEKQQEFIKSLVPILNHFLPS